MKKKRITYGVVGMMEYQAVIKMGLSQMKVPFTDGSATGYGMNPAMYTTDNLMVQNAIENSEDYMRGRIHIVDSVDIDEEVKIIRNVKLNAKPAPEVPTDDESEAQATDEEDESPEKVEGVPVEGEKQALAEMEFDNNDDAKDYLEQTFGCVRSKLRNRDDIKAAGLANGVSITFS